MDSPTLDAPTNAWQLDAPGSFVLLNGPEASGAEAFRLAVMDLVARGVLRVVDVEQSGFLGRTQRTAVLVRGDTRSLPTEGPLRSVWELHERTPATSFADGTTGVPVTQLVAAAQSKYGQLDGFVRDEIMPDLERRGLYEREAYRILWLIPATRWRLTPAGQQARAELERLMALGDERFRGWVDHDPGQALAYTALAGSALLLMMSSNSDFYGLPAGMDASGALANLDPAAFESLNTSFEAIAQDSGDGGDAAAFGGGSDAGSGGDGGFDGGSDSGGGE